MHKLFALAAIVVALSAAGCESCPFRGDKPKPYPTCVPACESPCGCAAPACGCAAPACGCSSYAPATGGCSTCAPAVGVNEVTLPGPAG